MKKIIFIIYAAVIALTTLMAFCFKQYVFIGAESLIPVIIMASMLFLGYTSYKGKLYYRGGRWRSYSDSFDFKYRKNSEGEGEFQIIDSGGLPDMTSKILGYTAFIGASLNIPLIIFFSFKVKLFSVGVMLGTYIVGCLIATPFEIMQRKRLKDADAARREQWQKELEEQKRREELGRWK